MKLRPIILPVFLSMCLAGIYFLPSSVNIAQSAVRMELLNGFGSWQFEKIPPSKAELEILADDTEFSKAVCLRPMLGEYGEDGRAIPERIDVSIVLSGVDINNSIHRPERCMPAQGHQILSSSEREIQLEAGKSIKVRRLISTQRLPTNEERTEFLELGCVTYYFFIGRAEITNSHLGRTLIDIKDRLLLGTDQRWAYTSLSMWYGDLPWVPEGAVEEAEADQALTEFLKNFAEEQIDWDQIKASSK